MLKVGLTGSIAVGKSHVCAVLAEHGCRVLDADQTAREVVLPGTIGLNQVVDHFGSGILNEDGSLNRKSLGRIIFSNKDKRQLLNSILHPLIIEAQDEWMKQIEAVEPFGIAVIDAALMIETGSYKRFDEIIVVWCESEIQVDRLMSRNSLSRKEAKRRIAAQMSQEKKKEYASFLIDSSGEYSETRAITESVLDALRRKAELELS